MKIKYVLHSVDNTDYYDFWPTTAAFCKRLGYTPVLFKISTKNSEPRETQNGIEINIQGTNIAPTSFQSQLARMWGSVMFKDEVVMTSDIDMFLLNKKYFDESVSTAPVDSFVNLTSNAYDGVRIPMCYNIATGETFTKILNLTNSFSEFVSRVIHYQGLGWDSDEIFLGRHATIYSKYIGLYRSFNEKWEAKDRIDRNSYHFNEGDKNTYIDCHFLRPYINHIVELNDLKKAYNIL